MRSQHYQSIALFISFAILAGCKLDASAPIYVGDLMEVSQSGKNIEASIDLNVPIPSVDKCDEYSAKIKKVIAGFFQKFEMQGCEKQGMDNFSKVKVNSEITSTTSEAGIYFLINKQQDQVGITLAQKAGFMASLMDAIKKEAMSTVDLSFSIRLNNDTRDKIKLVSQNVFVNQKAYAKKQEFELARRDEANIKLSDVAVAAFEAGENIESFSISTAK